MNGTRMDPDHAGFTLVELLVSIAVLLLVVAGVGTMYVANKSARISEDLNETMEAQLRLGMDRIMFSLRSAGYGVTNLPNSNMASWIPWVSGMTADPLVTAGSDANHPDTISIALCTSQNVGTFAAAFDATSCPVNPNPCPFTADAAGAAALTDIASGTTPKREVIYINDGELAQIYAKSGTSITSDTNPTVVGPQQLSKSYNIGTPFCRVDVVTFSVCPPSNLSPVVTCPTGIPRNSLYQDDNRSATPNPQVIVDGISNMKIVSTAAPSGGKPSYKVTLTATASQFDPLANSTIPATRDLVSTAAKRN